MTKVKTLENGIRLIVEENNSPITSLGILVNVGSQNESKEYEGVSHLVEHLMFKSTKNRTTEDIANQMAFLGTDNNAYTTKTSTMYHFKSLTKNFEESFEIYADMLQNGLLNEDEVNAEREVILEEINSSEDAVNHILYKQIDKQIFFGTTMEHPVLGNPDVVKNISIDKIREYTKQHYTPENMIFSVCGGVTIEQVEQLVRKYYANYFKNKYLSKNREQTPVNIKIKNKFLTVEKDDKQIAIIVSIKGKNKLDKEYDVQTLFASILGSGASSRMYSILREKGGLAYSVCAFAYSGRNFGTVNLFIETSKNKISKALVGMRKILLDMAKNGISEQELQRAKNQLKAELVFGVESNEDIMLDNATQLSERGKIESINEQIYKIDAITIEDVKRIAKQTFFEDEFVICAVGKDVNVDDLKLYETCVKTKDNQTQQQKQHQTKERQL